MYNIDNIEYSKFIDNNMYLTSCQKKILKRLIYNKNKFYVNPISNKQIFTFVYNANKQQNIIKTSHLMLLFNKFISYHHSIKLVNLIYNEKLSDINVIHKILEYKKNYKMIIDKNNIGNTCSSWKYILQKLAINVQSYFSKINLDIKTLKYLDVGCGDAFKTDMFGRYLNIINDNIFGTDIPNWGPYSNTQRQVIQKNNFQFIKNNNINYDDNSFDLVSCFLMLHHVEDLHKILSEIKRILKPNGIVVIIEHDCHDDFDHLIIDILHTCFGFIIDNNKNIIKSPNYSQYFNQWQWDFIFHKYNFNYIKKNYIFNSLDHDTRFDHIYYSIYSNVK